MIDLSIPVARGMIQWPGDAAVAVNTVWDAPYHLTSLRLSVHTGTHMDAPFHAIPAGLTMEQMPLDATIGPCRVIAIADPARITRAELQRHTPQAGERLLFRTANSRHAWWEQPFDEHFVHLANDAAAYLVECGVRTVGIDYLSVGGYHHEGYETHCTLLGAGIWVIEGLNLGPVTPGPYELLCLPLKVPGADGAPCRAVLR
ncbi:MAG: cyclase family protein [Bryobacteraceae bacterium]|nr:cyclase family protein [Bryobacteraceae bacterium]